jgi:CSLREA domain-containing protein
MSTRRGWGLVAAGALALTAFAVPAGSAAPIASAAEGTLKVTKKTDTNDGTCDSDCSLREAVVAANADPERDTIRVPAGTYKLTSPEGDLDIETEVAIEAVRGTAVIDGQNADRVLEITASGEAFLTGLEITNGRLQTGQGGGILNAGLAYITHSAITSSVAPTGGGIANSGGTLALRFTTVSDNSAEFGGGINNEGGRAEIETSLLWKNVASVSGGGLYNVAGEAHFRNSTVSANRTDGSGAGIYQISQEVVSIVSSTIIGNSADIDNDNGDGGGVFVGGGAGGGGALITNSLLFGNADGGPTQHPNCSGPLDSLGHNIIVVNAGCDTALEPTDVNGAAATGALVDNGGPTLTYGLPSVSLAVGHGPTGTVACEGTDQRGVPRTGPCDTGAYQYERCDTAVINVVGTDGRDELQGSQGRDGILAKGGADRVEAAGGADRVCGGAGNDQLFGGTGKDVLLGSGGNDRLDGGPGRDRCVGGTGKDREVSC